jgi:O-antigen/teichoic acid export membrane protein
VITITHGSPAIGKPGMAVFRSESAYFGVGLVDQALISISNLVCVVLVARSVSISDFGAFSLATAALLFANSIQNAIVTGPHAVFSAFLNNRQFREYTTILGSLQLVTAIGSTIILMLGSLILERSSPTTASAVMIAAFVTIVWQGQEFARRVMYAKSDAIGAAINDSINYGLQACAFAILWYMDKLSIDRALWAMGATSIVALTVGLWRIRGEFTSSVTLRRALQVFREIWHYGRWMLASSLTYWSSGQLFPVLAAAFVGLDATAAIRAAQTLLGPAHIFFRFVETSLTPTAARIRAQDGREALSALLARVAITSVAIFGLTSAFLLIVADNILARVFGESYAGYSLLLGLVIVSYLFLIVSAILSLGLRAERKSRPIFIAGLLSAIFALTLGPLLVSLWGANGAAVGLVMHAIITSAMLWSSYRVAEPAPLSLMSTP